MKILIVDDSVATLEIVRRALEKFGYRRLAIKKTNSAIEALSIIGSWRPEIVLTDWYMPDMTGLTLIQELMKRNLSVKIAMITTVDDPTKIQQAYDAGASFVLSKPFEDIDLHRKLLPLVQGAEESELELNNIIETKKELPLPKLSHLEKLLKREIDPEIKLNHIRIQAFNENKMPCLIAVYEDEIQRPRVVALLDIYAVCIFAHANSAISMQQLQLAIHSKMVGKDILDTCQQVLGKASLAFLHTRSRKCLRLKNISFLPAPFEKLERLFETEADKRLDFSCQLGHLAQGKITLAGF